MQRVDESLLFTHFFPPVFFKQNVQNRPTLKDISCTNFRQWRNIDSFREFSFIERAGFKMIQLTKSPLRITVKYFMFLYLSAKWVNPPRSNNGGEKMNETHLLESRQTVKLGLIKVIENLFPGETLKTAYSIQTGVFCKLSRVCTLSQRSEPNQY